MRRRLALLLAVSCLVVWHRISTDVIQSYRSASKAVQTIEGSESPAKTALTFKVNSVHKRKLLKVREDENFISPSVHVSIIFVDYSNTQRPDSELPPPVRFSLPGLRAPPVFV